MSAPDTMAPEQTGFELERFQWSGPDRLEVEGRWYGVRGRRFVRPVLTVQVHGRRRRLLAMLEHKPWQAAETESWIAAFPWEGPTDGVGEGELEVGALTVDLPPPGGAKRAPRRPGSAPAAAAPPAPAPAPVPSAEQDEEPGGDRRTASETRHQVERDLAGARAELGRLRRRQEEETRELRAAAREATERLEELSAQTVNATERAEQAADEAKRLREELRRERDGQGAELQRLKESDASARAEADRQREAAATAAAEAERQREAAAAASEELERLREASSGAVAEVESLREASRSATTEADQLRETRAEASAENQRLRQAARKASAEAERLRAASRRPGAPRPDPADAGPSTAAAQAAAKPEADPQATVPFQVIPDEPADDATKRVPPPTVRRIPRGQTGETAAAKPPAPETAVAAARPAGERKTTEIRGRPEPGAASSRLLGEAPHRRLGERSVLEVWGPRVAAIVLVAILLLALALIVRGII